jgi:hypothetical protein
LNKIQENTIKIMVVRNKKRKADLCILVLAENPPALLTNMELKGYIERMVDEGAIKQVYHFGSVNRYSAENVQINNPYARKEFLSHLKPGKEIFMGYFLASAKLKEYSLQQFRKRFTGMRYKIYKTK